jgi:hypothetical protein
MLIRPIEALDTAEEAVVVVFAAAAALHEPCWIQLFHAMLLGWCGSR